MDIDNRLDEELNDINFSNEEESNETEIINSENSVVEENPPGDEDTQVEENPEANDESHEVEENNSEHEEDLENAENLRNDNEDSNEQKTAEFEVLDETKASEDDETSLKQEEDASQISEDQDETVINNDSAYETNEINSQNGSDSRLQSANTFEGDIDNETGENFPLQSDIHDIEQMENIEIERLENELENPPTPYDDDDFDVVVSAVNSNKTEQHTEQVE